MNGDKLQKRWYAIYTKPRAEKKVKEELDIFGYEVFLPLRTELRKWKDRMKKVRVPLFFSYVFVYVDDIEYYELPKKINGFVRFVTIGGQRVEVRQSEIDAIKQMLDFSSETAEVVSESFKMNDEVVISKGSLCGLSGRLVAFRGKYKIAIRINSLNTSLLVEINKDLIEKKV